MSLFGKDKPAQDVWSPAAGNRAGFSVPPSVNPSAESSARLTSLRSAFRAPRGPAPGGFSPAPAREPAPPREPTVLPPGTLIVIRNCSTKRVLSQLLNELGGKEEDIAGRYEAAAGLQRCYLRQGDFRPATVAGILAAERDSFRLKPSCVVTGVVTYAHPVLRDTAIVADPGAPDAPGIYATGVFPEKPRAEAVGYVRLEEGDLLEIRGEIDPMLVEPGIVASRIVRIGRTALPPPRPGRAAGFADPPHWNVRISRADILLKRLKTTSQTAKAVRCHSHITEGKRL